MEMRRVAVAGIGETKFGRYPDLSLRDLIKEAGAKAIADAGLENRQIQALYMANFNAQYLCRQGHLGALAAEAIGLGAIPTIRTEGACASGSLAFRQAFMAVQAGYYDIVLVGGVEKMTHLEAEPITTAIASACEFAAEAAIGATFPAIFALIANRYFYEYGNAREAMAWCAVQNHDHALLNPDAHFQKKISVAQVLASRPVASPLTVYDCSPVSDGAAFVVLVSTEIAKSICKKRIVEIAGSGHAGDTLSVASKKSLTSFASTTRAALDAYEMAGCRPCDIDLAEVHDCFTITQILNIEDLGFFEKGYGPSAILEGKTTRDGSMPVNVSGGLKAKGHPIGATGISQIYEIVKQLRGEAAERQIRKADIGLTHNLGGTAATCLVHIFTGR
jgi:acetyl-CoA C-acetyltransferase